CPRCQTVFVKDIAGDAAFVECPSCGALALPAGDATGGALERALSGPQPAPVISPAPLVSTEAEQAPMPSDPSAPAAGMVASRVDDADGGGDVPAPPPMTAVSGSRRAPELDFNFGGDFDIDLPSLPPARTGEGPPVGRSDEGDSDHPRIGAPPVHALGA